MTFAESGTREQRPARSPERAEMPLAGIRVVDLSTSYAGPTATTYLADMGADVIKVERPRQGDDARAWGPPFFGEDSAWFHSANRNKLSIAVNLRNPAGRQVLARLMERADVLVENLNPAKLTSLGLDPQTVRELYPRIIYCAISGFGLTGPDSGLAGYDLVAQARSGLMSVTGAMGGAPQRVSTALSDIVTGLIAAFAITAALRRQERTGRGTLVDVSLLDADLALMAPRIASYLAGEPEPRPSGGTDSVLAVYQPFETADRPVVLAIGSDAVWQRFCRVAGLDDLATDPRLADNAGRRASRSWILPRIAERLRTRRAAHWLQEFAAAMVPAAPIQSLSEVVSDPQVRARGTLRALRATGGPSPQVVTSPWRLAELATGDSSAALGPVGSDTVGVLRALGFAGDQIEALLANGAVWSPAGENAGSQG